jgi:hypothetical protein
VWRQQDGDEVVHFQVKSVDVWLDGQLDGEGAGEGLEEEEESTDPGLLRAGGADPVLLDSVALATVPGQGHWPAVYWHTEPLQYGRGQGGLPADVPVEGLATGDGVAQPPAAAVGGFSDHL